MNSMYEQNLPPYLAHNLDAWEKGVEEHSYLLDCLWCGLYSSINIAEINGTTPSPTTRRSASATSTAG